MSDKKFLPRKEVLPQFLVSCPQWVCWNYEITERGETKVPYQAISPEKKAASTRPETWSDFDTAVTSACENHNGVGWVITPETGVSGIDLDKCIEAGTVNEWAQSIVDRLDTYTEISPSGTGLRLFVFATLPPGRRKKDGFEIYNSGRFLTVTGNRLPGTSRRMASCQDEIDALHAEMFPLEPEREKTYNVGTPLECSDDELLEKAFAAKNGDAIRALWDGNISAYGSRSEADEAFCFHITFYLQPGEQSRLDRIFRQSALMRPKWDQRRGEKTYGQMTVDNAFATVTEHYETSNYEELPTPTKTAYSEVSVDSTGSVNFSENTKQVDKDENLNSKQVDKYENAEKCQLSTDSDTSDDWGRIFPVASDIMPAFPLEALPPVIADYAANVAKTVQVPIDLASMSAIAVLSFAVSRRWQVQIRRSYIEPTNLYIASAMEPGSRKSSCLEHMVKPLRKMEKDLINIDKEGREEREELRKASEARLVNKRKELAATNDPAKTLEINSEISRIKDEMPADSPAPRLIVEDVTTERLVGLLQEQYGTMALISSEGGIFGTIGGRYSDGQVNVDVYLKGHDAEAYRVDRLNRSPEHIDNVRLTMCLTVQPDVIYSLTKKSEFRGRGLLGRFLYAIPADLRGKRLMSADDAEIDPELYHNYSNAIRGLLMSPPISQSDPYERHTVSLSKAALAIHMDFSNRIETQQSEEGDLRPFSDWASKLAGRVARIAACFHCLKHEHEAPETHAVSEETILQAWSLAEYFVAHATRAFDLMSESQQSRYGVKVLEWIKKKKPETFEVRRCYRDLQKSVPQKECVEALKLLALNNYIRPIEIRNKNNVRVDTYQVNPALLSKTSISVDS